MNKTHEDSREKHYRRLEWLVSLLDDAIPIPGTQYRIGIDPLLGLFPGIGDGIGTICSGLVRVNDAKLGAPKAVLLRMFGNVLFDAAIGLVPILGDIADASFKANRRNLQILRALPSDSWADPPDARGIAILVGGTAAVIAIGTISAGLLLLRELIRFLSS